MSFRVLIRNRWFGLAAKGGLSAFVLYLSVRNVDVQAVSGKVRALDVGAIALGLGICLIQTCLVALRWHRVVSFLGGTLSLWRALCIVEISTFFNQALPATVGGDGVRVFHVWQSGMAIERAVHSVLLDRLAGLAGLMLAGALGMPLVSGAQKHFSGLVGLVGLVVVTAVGMMIVLRRHWIAWLPGRLAEPVERFVEVGLEIARRPSAWFWMLLPSATIQLLSTLFIYAALRQFGIVVGFIDGVLLVTLVMLLVALPVSVAGWGVREGAMVVALGSIGVPAAEAVAASLLAGLAQLTVALPSGLLLLLYRPGSHALGGER